MNPSSRNAALEKTILDALRGVDDPEVGLDLVELGLVYGVEASASEALVRLTLTSAACPLGEQVVEDAEAAVRAACPQLENVTIELVWEPPWEPGRMSAAAREHLGWPADAG